MTPSELLLKAADRIDELEAKLTEALKLLDKLHNTSRPGHNPAICRECKAIAAVAGTPPHRKPDPRSRLDARILKGDPSL